MTITLRSIALGGLACAWFGLCAPLGAQTSPTVSPSAIESPVASVTPVLTMAESLGSSWGSASQGSEPRWGGMTREQLDPFSSNDGSDPKNPILREYTVQEGDNLWNLASFFYGKPWVWPLFLKFNSIHNPNLIHPGDTLLFPSFEVLEEIKDQSPEQVVAVREKLQAQATPKVVVQTTAVATSSATPAKPKPTAPPMPTAERTPTFKITGSKTINFNYSEAVGGSGTGTTNTGYDRHETLKLHMEGQLNEEVKIAGNFAQSDLALQDDYDLTLSSKHWDLYFGNFAATVPGSQFLSSGMSTTGLKGNLHYDDFQMTALYGTPQGTPFYFKAFGNQTQGPYTVPNTPIVPGSDVVWINKQKMTRGVDYNLDYTLGNLTFISRIVQLTDLIEVTGESSASAFQTQVYGYHLQVALSGKVPEAKPPVPTTNSAISGLMGRYGALGTPNGLGALGIPGVADASGNSLAANRLGGPTTTLAAPVSLIGSVTPGSGPATLAGVVKESATPTSTAVDSKFQWILGQGYLRQAQQPDYSVTTATGRAAADSQMLEMDTTVSWGPSLKLGAELDGSSYDSSDPSITPSTRGVAYHLEGESFQGPFHLLGKISGASPNFSSIGNPLTGGNYLNWTAQADIKTKDELFGQVDRNFQRTNSAGYEDDTTTDHGEAKAKPKGWPEADYVYYNSQEQQPQNPAGAFTQNDLKNTLSLNFGLPGNLLMKTSALQEAQTGSNLGENDSYGGRVEVSSNKWKDFNFNLSGEWRLNNIAEASSNTQVPTSAPGSGILSQTYTYTMEGKPIDHLTLTGKGTYSDAPPGPTKANLTETFKTDPYKWLNANGSYSLDFQQTQALGTTVPDEVHTGSGSLEFTPMSWLKLSTQPTFRIDQLVQYNQSLSQNYHQYYKAALTPDFVTFGTDYTLDQFWTWDGSTQGFPLNFYQQTTTVNLSAKKPIFKELTEEVSYKISDQNQNNYGSSGNTTQETINQTENDATVWTATKKITFTLSHAYNQMDQNNPSQGNLTNPLLPNGTDSFNTTFSSNAQNAKTYSHTFALRITEQARKTLSLYQEMGYTTTIDVLQNGVVETYSPACGFTWKPGNFLNWTGSYQFNVSHGEVDTLIQKAQTALTATLNPGATLALNWNWTRADDPFIMSQQGTVAYTMNF